MTKDEALAEMLNAGQWNEEAGHREGDAILCAIIREHLPEFAEVVAAWDELYKWYA